MSLSIFSLFPSSSFFQPLSFTFLSLIPVPFGPFSHQSRDFFFNRISPFRLLFLLLCPLFFFLASFARASPLVYNFLLRVFASCFYLTLFRFFLYFLFLFPFFFISLTSSLFFLPQSLHYITFEIFSFVFFTLLPPSPLHSSEVTFTSLPYRLECRPFFFYSPRLSSQVPSTLLYFYLARNPKCSPASFPSLISLHLLW